MRGRLGVSRRQGADGDARISPSGIACDPLRHGRPVDRGVRVRRGEPETAQRLPDFIIIGAMKCGTSTLHEQLALRPGLFMSEPKEPNFFSDDERYARGIQALAQLFRDATPAQRCGESSTHYTKLPTFPNTVERMQRHLPRVKLIYVMRDPIDRIVSQFIHEWSERRARGPFESVVRGDERFVAYSSYARQLEPYLQAYGADALLPVSFERMTEHPDEELARVCRFVGDPSPDTPGWSRELGATNISSQRLRKSPLRDRLLAWGPVRAGKELLPRGVRDRVKSLWQMRERPVPGLRLRAELEAALDGDLQRLGSWMGRELSCRGWTEQMRERQLAWVEAPARGDA